MLAADKEAEVWPNGWARWLGHWLGMSSRPVAARIESVVGAARAVYRYGVPDGPLPDTYLLVTGSVGETSSGNLSGLSSDRRTASVDVKSISRSLTVVRLPVRLCGALGRSWTHSPTTGPLWAA